MTKYFLAKLQFKMMIHHTIKIVGQLKECILIQPDAEQKYGRLLLQSPEARADAISERAIALVKVFAAIATSCDSSAYRFIDLNKHYFLNNFNWQDSEQEDYAAYVEDALWFCDEMMDYLKELHKFTEFAFLQKLHHHSNIHREKLAAAVGKSGMKLWGNAL